MNKTYEEMYRNIDKITKNNNKKLSDKDYKHTRMQLKKILSKN